MDARIQGMRDRACCLEADLRDARVNLRLAQEECGRRGHDWSDARYAPMERLPSGRAAPLPTPPVKSPDG